MPDWKSYVILILGFLSLTKGADYFVEGAAATVQKLKKLGRWDGLTSIVLGSDWVVDGASVIAESFGMSQNLIGLTVVAFGTSLPELVTSFTAARKNQSDMALGNVIGSNIFNILLILGLAAAISPMTFNMENSIDTALLILMLAEYAAYMVYICLR